MFSAALKQIIVECIWIRLNTCGGLMPYYFALREGYSENQVSKRFYLTTDIGYDVIKSLN